MEKQIIHQGISYIVNNIALSFASLSEIYKFLRRPFEGVLEFGIAVDFLDSTTTSNNRRVALSVVLGYRHYIAHVNRQTPLIEDLQDAVLTLCTWYNERVKVNKLLLSPMSEGELIVSLLTTAINAIASRDIVIEKTTAVQPVTFGSTPVQRRIPVQAPVQQPRVVEESQPVDDSDDTDDSELADDEQVNDRVAQIELTDVLRTLRYTDWKEKIKQRKIIILDGKHANKTAKFLYWSGTVAYVRIKGEQEATGIPIDRRVSVLYSKYLQRQFRE